MQFLVITKQVNPAPPEMVLPLFDAMQAWVAEHRASGKMKSVWAFAGTPGGGGVLEVDSHEELDAIMVGFPFQPFSSVEIIALSDIDKSLEAAKGAIQRMMGMLGGR